MGIIETGATTYYASGGPHGNYRFISLTEIIDSFMATYVGKNKICDSVLSQDVTFHALRAMQELSYDTLKSVKDWEVEIPAALTMILPHDYVNYVKLSWSDSAGIEHIIYPMPKSSNPRNITEPIESWGGLTPDAEDGPAFTEESDTWDNYQAATPSENAATSDDYIDDNYWPSLGNRYGLNPVYAQINGHFFIDEDAGKFHFSSNLSGKTVILKYISDGIVTDKGTGHASTWQIDMTNTLVPKLAEEAIYKWILYGVLLARKNTNPNLLMQVKKERFAETRKAKLRLSNIKLEELTQTLRGGSKIIKH